MHNDPIRGRVIHWTFQDGPMAGKSFEHTFDASGSVTWRMLDADGAGKLSPKTKYEVATVGEGVSAVSYLGSSGYTLTVILDSRTGRLVAFGSNEKSLTIQHGTFDVDDAGAHAGAAT